MSVKIGDLVCFKWHHAFFDSSKDLGREHGTEHIPVGIVLKIDFDATSYCNDTFVPDPTAQIVWQRQLPRHVRWRGDDYRLYKTRTNVLRVLEKK
jgi:hypothetical protein